MISRSDLFAPDVIALILREEPNPTLEVYLDLVEQAGARLSGVEPNEPHAVIKRIKELMARENVSTVSALARIAGVHRSTLSTLLNAAAPNPTLDVFDKLVHAPRAGDRGRVECDTRRVPEATVGRVRRVLRFMASVGAVTIVVGVVYGLTRAAPPREVEFVGGPGSDGARCHGSVLWTGEVAYATCDWAYRERAVVAFDPAAAQAKVLHLWSSDDGTVPVLEIVRPCEGGQLFVVRETGQTTLLRRRGEEVRVSKFASQWDAVLGAACSGDAVELFTTAGDHNAIYRVAGERPELRKVIGRDETPGAIVAAWFADDAWHVVVHDRKAELLLAGKLGSELARIGDRSWGRPPCLVGEPGGWLGTSDMLSCFGGVVAWRADGGFRVTQLERAPHELVVHAATPGFGFSFDDPGVVRFRGPEAPELDLYERDGVFQARRGDGAVVTIAGASHSTLNVAPRALPLSGDRVAIWGGIGDRVAILGPDLRRLDAPGPLARVLRPWRHFRASARSTFDLLCFYALLLAAPAWLLARLTRGRRAPDSLTVAAGLFVALCLVGAWGFVRVVRWL